MAPRRCGQLDSAQAMTGEPQPSVPWTLVDVATAYLCAFAGVVVGYIAGRATAHDLQIAFVLSQYCSGIIGLTVPIILIRFRYGLPLKALGLQRGKIHPTASVALGVGLAVAYRVLVRGHLVGPPIAASAPPSYLALVLTPISLGGFAPIFLAPLGEEVIDRGLLYPYLRKVMGTRFALLVQAIVFSGLHFGSWYHGNLLVGIDRFLLGLILGLLYEKTRSLYPSIVCHGTINYLTMLFPLSSG